MNKKMEDILPLHIRLGYKGYLGVALSYKDEKDNKIKKCYPHNQYKFEYFSFFMYCECGKKEVKPVDKYYDDKELSKIYCDKCGNQNFLINPINKYVKIWSVHENDTTIKVYLKSYFIKVNKVFVPFVDSVFTTGYFISKKNGTIQKVNMNEPVKQFKYTMITEDNFDIVEYVMPLLLKDTHKEFDILLPHGTNFSIFSQKYGIKTQDDLCKNLFKYTYTKSVKREFFENLNNQNIWLCENYLLIYKALGKFFKDSNNVVKVLKSTFFLEKFGFF